NHFENTFSSAEPELAFGFRPHLSRIRQLTQQALHERMQAGRLIAAASSLALVFVTLRSRRLSADAGLDKSTSRRVYKTRVGRRFRERLSSALFLFRRDSKLLHLPLDCGCWRQRVPLVLLVHLAEQFGGEEGLNA